MTEWLAVRNNNVSILFRTPSTRFQAAFIGKQVSNIGSLKPLAPCPALPKPCGDGAFAQHCHQAIQQFVAQHQPPLGVGQQCAVGAVVGIGEDKRDFVACGLGVRAQQLGKGGDVVFGAQVER